MSYGSANVPGKITPEQVGAAPAVHTHSGYVPTTRKVNNKPLNADITLSADDVGAIGRSMAGKTVKPTSDTTVTASSGAEIFNDYRARTFSSGVFASTGNVASGEYSHAEGCITTASGEYSHAEGCGTTASGGHSHAEGYGTKASATYSHAEGYETTASGGRSHAEGSHTAASGSISHAEGVNTTASEDCAHAEGQTTTASGKYSHAEGCRTTASGYYSHAGGIGTIAAGSEQTAIGEYNVESASETNKLIIGKGTDNARANCFRVTDTGTYAAGNYNASGADYAELFEWADGNPDNEDRAGLFVILDGEMIRVAAPEDDYILGVVSGNPSIVGDVHDDQWAGMYLYDVFGRPLWEDVEVPDETVEEPDPENPGQTITRVLRPAHTEHRQQLNPAYDGTKKYQARTERPEWDAVGLLGKLVAVDDGTCQVNGWATVGEGGIATASNERTRYRVMCRLDESHVRVMILP